MPRMGLAHDLLSPTHPDTQAPAAGADPDDGQVVAWSDELGAFHAADPAGGVTDHGALAGLFPDDDHPQYAKADKSRPSPWVAAADLSARSLADLGTKDHHLLADLDHDDHSIYVLGAGRETGQNLYGGIFPGEGLGLACRAGATTGILGLQEASPQAILFGDLDVSGHIAAGSGAAVGAGTIANLNASIATHPAYGERIDVVGTAASSIQLTAGLIGASIQRGTPSRGFAYGLYYYAAQGSSSPMNLLAAVYAFIQSEVGGTGAIPNAYGFYSGAAGWLGVKPTTVAGMKIEQQGGGGVATAYGLHILDQTATTVRLLELGPAVPYMRLGGGANPAANESKLSLKLGSTLKQITEYDADSAGAGYRALRVPN